MLNAFSRTELIYGREAMERLSQSRVLVVGIGGVGGYVVEALARSGVGALDLVDDDRICLTNINRQIYATHSTVGRFKVEVAAERIHDICAETAVRCYRCFYLPDTADQFDLTQYDYIVDAIDTVKGKLELVTRAKAAGVPVISSMGAGNKIDPSRFRVADIYDTRICPLARVMRGELRKRGVDSLKVVYSDEAPIRPVEDAAVSCRTHCVCPPGTARKCTVRRDIPGSTAFVPSVAGLLIAGAVVNDLTAFDPGQRRAGV
ncbi:MAG TPA: tRNA threonylcarbamoyladenosine dehydratase [Candidatus Limiplasma sp.]|nr:tRNA threonylcarbamoyladenosine dehydratase [Candidatus Limiplasma sp.]HPS82534.1 tRNA threonylcarbamoyladenosine dehydratase [Candidatus Limiplasma sp.]